MELSSFLLGSLLAEATIFIVAVTTLSLFDITKEVVDGKVIEPVYDQTSGIIWYVLPYFALQ